MLVILSHTPAGVISSYLKKHPVKRWVYLGKDFKTHQKLSHLLAGRQEVVYSKILYEVSNHNRKTFVEWIDQISSVSNADKRWLFSVSSIKNPYNSDLFLNICYFFVVKELQARKEEFDLIIVDSPALSRILKSVVKSTNGQIIEGIGQKFRGFFKSLLRSLRYCLDFIVRIFWARRLLKTKESWKNNAKIILIRNFIPRNYKGKDDGIFENHFFPGLYDYLVKKGFQPVFCPATVQLPLSEYQKTFQKIAALNRDVLVPEQVLSAGDYWYAVLAPLRALWFKLPAVPYRQLNFLHLLKEDYVSNVSEFGLLYANLLNRVGKRLDERGIKPAVIINWNENQSLEKGLLSGLKEQFSALKIFGSQAFIPSLNHLSLIYAKQDELLNIKPDRLLTLGPIEQEMAVKFLPLNVQFSPLFRYSKVFDSVMDNNKKDLLVVMGFGFNIAVRVMDILIKISGKLTMFDRVMIKFHPASYFTLDQIKDLLNVTQLPAAFHVVSGDINEHFQTAALGICTGGTGAAVEMIVKGIPVVMIAEERALTLNVLAEKKDDGIWRLAFTEEEVIDSINVLINQEKDVIYKKAQNFKESFFAVPSDNYWEHYLP